MTHLLSQLYDSSAEHPVSYVIRVAGQVIRCHFGDEALFRYFSPPLCHLEVAEQASDFDIFCCLHPVDVSSWLSANGLDCRPHKTFRQGGNRYCSQENGLFWIDETARKGFFLSNEMNGFEPYRSKPFSRLLCWFFEQLGMLWCHGACLGNEHGGVLLPGIGGAGKSTTVASALLGRMRFLGDDYLLIEPKQRRVNGIYASLMLSEESRRLLGVFPNADLLQPEFLGNKDKWCHYLYPHFRHQLDSHLPLRAILVPQIVPQQDSFISGVSKGEVMNALTSSMQTAWLMGSDPAFLLRGFYSLTENLPLGRLNVGSDLRQIPGVVNEFLNGR